MYLSHVFRHEICQAPHDVFVRYPNHLLKVLLDIQYLFRYYQLHYLLLELLCSEVLCSVNSLNQVAELGYLHELVHQIHGILL